MSAAVLASPAPHAFPDSPDRSYSSVNASQSALERQWRDLANVVRDVEPTLKPNDELEDMEAAEKAVQAKDTERAEVVDKLRDELRALTKQFNAAQQAAQRPPSAPSASEHDAQVRSLEQQQYSIGKQLNEEQAAVGKKEAELGRWRAEKEAVSSVRVGEDDWVDGRLIRLKLLSEAGFSLLPPKEDNASAKVLIRNDVKEDIHTVTIDRSRSKAYYANMIWGLASD